MFQNKVAVVTGIAKGRPGRKDLEKARRFYRDIQRQNSPPDGPAFVSQ